MSLTRRSFVASASAIALPCIAQAKSQSWPLRTPQRTGIHDVAPAPDGGVWFTAQASGHLGWFDPKRMEADYELVKTYFGLEKPFYIKETYTDEFLDRTIKMAKE